MTDFDREMGKALALMDQLCERGRAVSPYLLDVGAAGEQAEVLARARKALARRFKAKPQPVPAEKGVRLWSCLGSALALLVNLLCDNDRRGGRWKLGGVPFAASEVQDLVRAVDVLQANRHKIEEGWRGRSLYAVMMECLKRCPAEAKTCPCRPRKN